MGLTQQQRERRLKGITATDIGKVLGVNPYEGPFDVWKKKCEGKIEIDDPNDAQVRGLELEEYCVRNVGRLLDVPTEMIGETFESPFEGAVRCFATPDGGVPAESGDWSALVEAKSLNWMYADTSQWGEELTDQVPRHYFHQAHWQLGVCQHLLPENPVCYIGCQTGLEVDDCLVYRIQFDPELWELTVQQAASFWVDHVKSGRPPEPGGAKNTGDTLGEYYRQKSKEYLPANKMVDHLATELFHIKAKIEELKSEKSVLENRFKMLIGEDYGFKGDWGKVLWTQYKDRKKTDKDALIADLRTVLSDEEFNALKDKHTETVPGIRSFRTYFDEEFFDWEEDDAEEQSTG